MTAISTAVTNTGTSANLTAEFVATLTRAVDTATAT
jgi:hypothetical protein